MSKLRVESGVYSDGEIARTLKCDTSQVRAVVREHGIPHYTIGFVMMIDAEWIDSIRKNLPELSVN